MAKSKGIGVLTWSPLAGGFLTGKYQPDTTPKDERYGSFWGNKDKMFDETAFKAHEELKEIAISLNVSLDQLSISWLLHQPLVSSIIIGPRTIDQLESNLGALEIKLTDEELKRIDEIFRPFEMITPFYGPNVRNGFGFVRWGPYTY